jgi:hypothetical protein
MLTFIDWLQGLLEVSVGHHHSIVAAAVKIPLQPELVLLVVPVVVVVAGGNWIYSKVAKTRSTAASAATRPSPSTAQAHVGPSTTTVVPASTIGRAQEAGRLCSTPIDPEIMTGVTTRPKAGAQEADIAVFAPPEARPSAEILVQVIIHTLDREAKAEEAAHIVQQSVERLALVPLAARLNDGDYIKITLACEGAAIPEPVQKSRWNARLLCLYFKMRLPETKGENAVKPELRVFVNGAEVNTIAFRIKIKPNAPDVGVSLAMEQRASSLGRRFISYASEDRVQVLKAVQVMKANKLPYFQDTLSLEPGDRWKHRLFDEIEKCDVFLLFWSEHARRSKWVIKEAEYALECSRRQPLEIVPLLLEGPPPPKVPESLREIHFNDPTRHVIFAEEIAAAAAGITPPPPTESLVLRVGPLQPLAIGPDTKLYAIMLGSAGAGLGKEPIAETEPSPRDPSVMGLRNLSTRSWTVVLPNGKARKIAQGEAVRLASGVVIDFGGRTGTVEAAG